MTRPSDAREVIRSEALDALSHWLPPKAFPLDEIADDIAGNCLDAIFAAAGVEGAGTVALPGRWCPVTTEGRCNVYPRESEQRFALAAENIEPTPWAYQIVMDGGVVASGQASFRWTAWVKGRWGLAGVRHRRRMLHRSRRRMERQAAAGGVQ